MNNNLSLKTTEIFLLYDALIKSGCNGTIENSLAAKLRQILLQAISENDKEANDSAYKTWLLQESMKIQDLKEQSNSHSSSAV